MLTALGRVVATPCQQLSPVDQSFQVIALTAYICQVIALTDHICAVCASVIAINAMRLTSGLCVISCKYFMRSMMAANSCLHLCTSWF